MLKIFVINLALSNDRRAYMEQLCGSTGLSVEFISAVYGKALSAEQISHNIDQNRAKAVIGRELMLGEIGCALSHKTIYQKMIDENISEALILEDDIYFEPYFKEALNITLTKRPKNSELILLGHHSGAGGKSLPSFWGKHKINEQYTFSRLADFGFGTFGYFITQSGAKKLLNSLGRIYQPIDHYTCDSNTLNVYMLEPAPINYRKDMHTLIDEELLRLEKTKKGFKRLLENLGLFPLVSSLNKVRKQIRPIKRYH